MTSAVVKKSSLAEQLRQRIEHRTARVAVVGMGYVGLPLAETFAWGGYPVTGFDIDTDKVAKLNLGQSYIGHICSDRVAELVQSGRFEATTDPECFQQADAIVICVPTPLTETREPDLSYIVNTGRRCCRTCARPTRRPGEHHLPRHDQGIVAAHPRRVGTARRQGFLPGLQSGA